MCWSRKCCLALLFSRLVYVQLFVCLACPIGLHMHLISMLRIMCNSTLKTSDNISVTQRH